MQVEHLLQEALQADRGRPQHAQNGWDAVDEGNSQLLGGIQSPHIVPGDNFCAFHSAIRIIGANL